MSVNVECGWLIVYWVFILDWFAVVLGGGEGGVNIVLAFFRASLIDSWRFLYICLNYVSESIVVFSLFCLFCFIDCMFHILGVMG